MTTTRSKTATKKTEEKKTPAFLSDPFVLLGTTTYDDGFTTSYAGVIAGVTYLKTVTVNKALQSETLTKLEGNPQIVPSNIKGFYKVI